MYCADLVPCAILVTSIKGQEIYHFVGCHVWNFCVKLKAKLKYDLAKIFGNFITILLSILFKLNHIRSILVIDLVRAYCIPLTSGK